MILNRGYLLGLKDWSWSLSHEQRKKVFWFTYSTSDGAFYSQRNYTNPRRQVPPLRSRNQILVEIYDSEEKGFILPRILWTRSNFFPHTYKGDSGGPFVCNEGGRWVLRGAVSWGHGKCRTDHYTVFARVSNFVNWIKQKQSSKFLILLRKRNFWKERKVILQREGNF